MAVDADRSQPPWAALIQWRQRMLVSAGFDDELATRLAGERGLDLHALLELVDQGCPPPLAARILAPLQPEFR